MLGRNFSVGMQTTVHIALPKLDRFRQKGGGGRGSGALRSAGGHLLAIFGTAVGKNLPHDSGAGAPYVSFMVHQKLIQQA